jgi:hypothetical protein
MAKLNEESAVNLVNQARSAFTSATHSFISSAKTKDLGDALVNAAEASKTACQATVTAAQSASTLAEATYNHAQAIINNFSPSDLPSSVQTTTDSGRAPIAASGTTTSNAVHSNDRAQRAATIAHDLLHAAQADLRREADSNTTQPEDLLMINLLPLIKLLNSYKKIAMYNFLLLSQINVKMTVVRLMCIFPLLQTKINLPHLQVQVKLLLLLMKYLLL